MKDKANSSKANILRQKAEELLNTKEIATVNIPSEIDALRLVQELDVHKIELEMQNEELLLAKKNADANAEKYQDLYNFASSGYLTLSKEGVIMELNLRGAELLGRERTYLIKSYFAHFISEETRPIFYLFLETIFKTKAKENCEVLLRLNKDGNGYDVYLSGITSEDGEQCSITMLDISKLKKAEEEIKEKEKYRTLIESNRDSITIFRIDKNHNPGNFIEVNPATITLFGYSKKELLAMSVKDIEKLSDKKRKFRLEALKSKGRIDFESVIKNKKGNQRNVEIETLLINYLNEPAVMNITRDITERKQTEDNIRKTQENLSTILEAIPDLLFEADLEGRIYHYQAHRKDLFAIPASEFIGKTFKEVLPVYAANACIEAIHEANKKGWSTGKQYSLDLPQGKKWFELSASPIKGSNDKDKHFILLARDITERKLGEIALHKSQENLQGVFDLANSGIIVIDLKGKYLLFNNWCLENFGYTRAEMDKLSSKELTNPDDFKKADILFNRIIEGETNRYQLEKRFIRKDKSFFWGEMSASAIKDATGKTVNIIGIITDITERKQAEEKLKQSESRLITAQALAKVGSWETDLSFTNVVWSKEIGRIFGLDPETTQITLEKFLAFVHPEDRFLLETTFVHSIKKHTLNTFEHRIITADGIEKTVEERWEILRDKEGQPYKAVGTCQDISERKLAEKYLIESKRFAFATLDALSAHIAILDENGYILAVNAAWRNFTESNSAAGLDLQPIEGQNYLAVCETSKGQNAEEALAMAAGIHSVMNGEQDEFSLKYSCHSPTEKRWFNARVTRFAGKGDLRIVVAHENITQIKQAELALVNEKQRLDVIITGTDTGTWEWNIQTGATIFNERWAEIIGYTLEELAPISIDTWKKFTHPDDLKYSAEKLEKHFKGELDYYECEVRMKHKNGDWVWVLDRGRMNIWDSDDKPLLISGTHQDITERKLSEEKLIDNEHFLNQTQIIAKLGSYSLDFTTGKWTSTTVLDNIFGINTNFDRTVEGWTSIIHPEWRTIMSEYLTNEVIGKKVNFNKEYKIITIESKEERWVHGMGKISFNNKGEPLQLIGSIQDISERKFAEEKLKLSSEKFQDLVNSTGGIVWEADANTFNFTFVSEQAERLLGYAAKEWLSPNFWKNHLHPEDKEHTIEYCVSCTKQMKAHDFTYRFRAKDGKYIWLRDIVNVVVEDGKPRWLRGVMFDISMQKENEESLRENEEKYRGLVENSPDGILIYCDDKIAFINDEGLRMLGATNKDDIINKPVLQFVHPDSLKSVIQRMEEVVSDHKASKIVEERFVGLKGVPFDVEIKAIPTVFEHKKAVQVIVHDITERKRTEEKIRQLSQAVEQSPVTIVITNTKGEIEYANPKFVETTGYTLEEVIHQNPRVLKSGYSSPDDYKVLWQTISAGKEWHGEFHNKKKDGSLYWESASISPIVNSEGIITHFIAIKEDITHRKNVEKQLIKSKEHAEESDRLKLAFLANMSHEIRTPMNGILGFTELLKAPHLSDEEQREYIKIIEQSGTRMLNIINDIISISKVESGQIDITLSETNVNEQIEYIHTFFKPEAKQKGIQLTISKLLSANDTLIKTDREKVYAILTNLVKNALKFTTEGSIEFGCEKKGAYLEFYIKDTGLGISKSQKKIIFERFRQANETISRSHEGSGLGLAISKAYVEILGGKIWVESKEGKGSTFYFTIPFHSENKTEEKNVVEKVSSGVKEENKIKDLKVLIVEDDAISKLLVTIAVKPYSKEIIKVSTGIEAIDTCRNNPDIDLVMMDINMPEMGGYEATKQIREFNKDLVIIAQTANAMQSDRDDAIAAGCTDYISKPINITSLGELIQKYFNK